MRVSPWPRNREPHLLQQKDLSTRPLSPAHRAKISEIVPPFQLLLEITVFAVPPTNHAPGDTAPSHGAEQGSAPPGLMPLHTRSQVLSESEIVTFPMERTRRVNQVNRAHLMPQAPPVLAYRFARQNGAVLCTITTNRRPMPGIDRLT